MSYSNSKLTPVSSPYHECDAGMQPYPQSMAQLDAPNYFTTPLPDPMPELSTYDLDFPGFFVSAAPSPPNISGMTYQTNLSHLTPVSEPCDMPEAITPLSLHPPFDFTPASNRSGGLAPINTSIDVPPHRPRSSPSTFGPAQGWPSEVSIKHEDGLGIDVPTHQLTPASSPRPRHQHSISSVSDSQASRRHWTPIAPHPIGLRQLHVGQKRALSSDDDIEVSPATKRKRSSPPSPNVNADQLSAEDVLLLKLKDEENLSWKEIASRFQTDMNKTFQIPALQMRLKRLRERMRVWTDMDVQALRLAHDYWQNNKFEIIATKMVEFGATDKWSAKQCSRKWQEIGFAPENHFNPPFSRTPTFTTSYTSSPIEGPGPGYYPFPVTTS